VTGGPDLLHMVLLRVGAGRVWKLQKGELESFRKGSLKVRILAHEGSDSQRGVLEIRELVTYAS